MLNRLITGKNPMLDIVVRKNGNGSRFRTMQRGSPPVKNQSCTMQPLHWNETLAMHPAPWAGGVSMSSRPSEFPPGSWKG